MLFGEESRSAVALDPRRRKETLELLRPSFSAEFLSLSSVGLVSILRALAVEFRLFEAFLRSSFKVSSCN